MPPALHGEEAYHVISSRARQQHTLVPANAALAPRAKELVRHSPAYVAGGHLVGWLTADEFTSILRLAKHVYSGERSETE